MCTAYELGKRGGSFPERLNAAAMEELLRLDTVKLSRPTLQAPVILPDGRMRVMQWGFRRSFTPKVKGRPPVWRTIVNSREDKLGGPAWRSAFAERRCLIPASAFYEWVVLDGRKVPLRFERPGDDWLWIAGIWETDEKRGDCFSMITTEPNKLLESVHDRMPAVLSDGQINTYLDGELNEYGPSIVNLCYREVANFLKKDPAEGAPVLEQGNLF